MDSPAPTITAAMLARDRAALLASSARSVLAQGDGDLELVILDDGSRDATWAVAEQLAAEDPRVVLLRNAESVGIPAARNQVLAAARGTYLAVCDSDDLSDHQRFARQRAVLDSDPGLVGVGSGLRAIEGAGDADPDEGTEPSWHWGLRDGRLPFHGPSALLRVDALRAAGGFDERFALAEDLELCYRLAARGGRFASVDEVLVTYRIHAGSITQRRAVRREWYNLRAQLRGLRLLRGRFSLRGYAVIGQSVLRTALAAIGVRADEQPAHPRHPQRLHAARRRGHGRRAGRGGASRTRARGRTPPRAQR
jgi:glycosyltransferase involved in cell wall biosynthesis